jgi:adenosylhomocysteine nucleosidase
MKSLLVFALQEESQDVFSGYDLLHTGVGKVNAAYSFTRYILNSRPSLVINMGTAGSRKHPPGTIINPVKFIQRDMDVTALGFEPFKTPFSSEAPIVEYGTKLEGLISGVCGTGDNFDTSVAAAAFDVVDMEAYALAVICQRESIPFLCLKYVSDGADDEAHKDWNAALHHAAECLFTALKGAGL